MNRREMRNVIYEISDIGSIYYLSSGAFVPVRSALELRMPIKPI